MGFAILVLDKDRKFYGVCQEALDLHKINCHVFSGDNHNPMLVERLCRYFNKGLTIMCNERDTICVSLECLLLLLYAWNSCPIPGTDISRSLIAGGCKMAFPIDYSSGKHWQLTSSPASAESYSKELATRLSACCKVANLLVTEQRNRQWALVNSCRPDPCVYLASDIVFACHATHSNASKGCVRKLEYKFTRPWKIVESLKGALYAIENGLTPTWKEKMHASDLTSYPQELIPFKPVNGTNTQYGQLFKPIGANPFKEAGLKDSHHPPLFKLLTSTSDEQISDHVQFIVSFDRLFFLFCSNKHLNLTMNLIKTKN
jgi:hypothetical protein